MTETGPTRVPHDARRGVVTRFAPSASRKFCPRCAWSDLDGRCAVGRARRDPVPRPHITPAISTIRKTAAAIDRTAGCTRATSPADEAGDYYIVDRITDMYISGGENVYARRGEGVLTNHPAVLEAAVIGVADERWGEVGHAIVRLRPGQACEAEALRTFARTHLAAYKVPKYVTVVDDYPRTAAGKVQKHVLRKSIASGT